MAANLGVAATFLAILLPWAPQWVAMLPLGFTSRCHVGGHPAANPIAASIWIMCALVMAVLSLVRPVPSAARTDFQALIATSGMLILPLLMRPLARSAFLSPARIALEAVGVIFQLAGLILMQASRLYLGRHFGLLPANRGIVTRGSFRLIRHPLYTAWLMTAFGTSMAFPTVRNFSVVALTIPFMVWRIAQEEELLDRDPLYLDYRERVRWRLMPFLF